MGTRQNYILFDQRLKDGSTAVRNFNQEALARSVSMPPKPSVHPTTGHGDIYDESIWTHQSQQQYRFSIGVHSDKPGHREVKLLPK